VFESLSRRENCPRRPTRIGVRSACPTLFIVVMPTSTIRDGQEKDSKRVQLCDLCGVRVFGPHAKARSRKRADSRTLHLRALASGFARIRFLKGPPMYCVTPAVRHRLPVEHIWVPPLISGGPSHLLPLSCPETVGTSINASYCGSRPCSTRGNSPVQAFIKATRSALS